MKIENEICLKKLLRKRDARASKKYNLRFSRNKKKKCE